MFAIHPVNQGFTLVVGLETEGQVPMPVPLHLFREKCLNLPHRDLHRIDHFGAKGAVIGPEVDHPHGARVPDLQRRRLGG